MLSFAANRTAMAQCPAAIGRNCAAEDVLARAGRRLLLDQRPVRPAVHPVRPREPRTPSTEDGRRHPGPELRPRGHAEGLGGPAGAQGLHRLEVGRLPPREQLLGLGPRRREGLPHRHPRHARHRHGRLLRGGRLQLDGLHGRIPTTPPSRCARSRVGNSTKVPRRRECSRHEPAVAGGTQRLRGGLRLDLRGVVPLDRSARTAEEAPARHRSRRAVRAGCVSPSRAASRSLRFRPSHD